jgi:hypothetical protein
VALTIRPAFSKFQIDMAKIPEKPGQEAAPSSQTGADNPLVGWLFKLILGGNDPEREKRRQLKILAKEFSRVKYKFYRPKDAQALPQLAKFFFECYKVTSNAAVILQNSDKSNALKSICIESQLSAEQRQILERFSEDSIREQSRVMDPKDLAGQLKEDLVNFFASFDNPKVVKINETFTLLTRLLRFISFDFYFVLKKFDSSLIERNFASSPKFEPINGEYISDDIKDFQEISLILDKQDDWNTVFDILHAYKGLDPVDRNEWSRILNILHQINGSDVLSMVVRHVTADPYYKPVLDKSVQRIVEPYIEKTRTHVEAVIQKIATEKRDAQIEKLCTAVFGSSSVQRTKYYTDSANGQFSKKVGAGFMLTAPVNYLKAFLLDYFKKDVRELQELILVRGKWTSNVLSQQMSDVYYQVMAISDQLIAFDESLSEDGESGAKLRKAMARVVDRDVSSGNSLRQILNELNEVASRLINDGAQNLITFGKYLRTAIEDIDKKDHEIIINWKELEAISDVPLRVRMSEIYKKLYYFIQLLQIYARQGKGSSSGGNGNKSVEVNIPDEE